MVCGFEETLAAQMLTVFKRVTSQRGLSKGRNKVRERNKISLHVHWDGC